MKENIKKMLIDGYNALSFTKHYIMGFAFQGVIYFTVCGSKDIDNILTLDKASRGAGYSLRFKPNKAQKTILLSLGAKSLCSVEYFNTLVCESEYNRGEIFEKLITEYFGQVWEKDNVPFTQAGDITINSIPYQIKFEKATFTNEKSLARMRTLAL